MSTTYATGINGNPIAASEVKPSSSLGTKLDGKASTSHTHSVIINGSTKEIAATGGSAVNLGTYLTSHQTIKQDGVTGSTSNRFGTCSTAAGTAGKEVSITSGTFSLEAGARVAVQFSNANTASSPTLKVGSTAAKNIFVNGSQITTGSNKGLLKGTVVFIYDGTQYNLIGNYYDTTYSGFVCANCSTAAGTAAKVASATNYTAKEGNVILVNFASTNSAAGELTLKVGGVTAPIKWNGTLTASGTTSAIPAGTWPCTYDGTNWNIYTDGSYLYKRVYATDLIAANTISVGSTTPSYVELRQKLKDGVSTFYAVTLVAASSQVLFMPMLHNTNSAQLDYGSIGFGTVHNGIYYYVSYSSGNVWSSIYTVNILSDSSISAGTDLTVSASGGTVTIAVDTNGTASGTKAFVEGNSTTASANYAHAEGNGTTASQDAAHAEGTSTTASGYNAHAEGQSSAASGDNAHAEGYNTSAARPSSHSEGTNSRAENKQAHAEGFASLAYGESSHAEGSCCVTGGVSAHAEGGATYAGGKDAHAEGFSNGYTTAELAAPMNAGSSTFTFASGTSMGAHNYIAVPSIGFFSKVVSSAGPTFSTQGSISVALPAGTLCMFVSSGAVGYVSHSEGFKTLALERSTHAEGDCTKALGAYSHAEGSDTTASGTYSHAEGQDTVTSGAYAHAEGLGTVAQGDYMHVAGKYNYSKSGYARVTGWGTGTADADRKDIERLDTDGNLWVNGHFIGATPFYVYPGTTTYAEIESAFNERRPLIMDVSYLNASANAVFVPASMRKVPLDANLEHFEYHFKFEYPFNYRAGYYAGSMESYVLYECYIAVNEQNGWLKLDLSDPNDLETRVWNTWSTSGNIAPVPVEYANRAVNAKYATNYLAGGNIASALSGKANSSHTHPTTDLTITAGDSVIKDATEIVTSNIDGYNTSASSNDKNLYRRSFGTYFWPWIETKLETGSSKTISSTINTGNFGFLAKHGTSGKWVGVGAKRTDTDVSVDIEVGGDGKRHGVWSSSLDDWLLVHSSDGLSSFWISGSPNRKAMVNAVATTLGYCATNEINFTHVPTSGNKNRTWFNYRNGDTWAADSSNTNDYYVFGNRNNQVATTLCATGIYPGEPGTTPSVKVKIMGGLTVTNLGQTAGAKLACGTIQTDSAIQKSTATYTVSKTDLSDGADGVLYIYINKYTDTQTATWKNWAGSNSSGPVYPGCAAMFICIKYSDGTFARIS